MLAKTRLNIITAFSLFSLFMAAMIPLCAKSQLWVDEVLDSDPAYNLAFRHKLSLDVWEKLEGAEKVSFVRPPFHSLVLSYLYRTLGFKRWVTLGLPLLSAALTLVVIYFIAILLVNEFWVATFSSILFGLSALGVNSAKWGRLNALAMFLFSASFLLLLLARRQESLKKYLLTFFSGILLGLSAQTYQLYGLLFIGYLVYYFFYLRKEDDSWLKEMLVFITAFIATFALWISFILQDIGLFKEHFVFVFLSASNLKYILSSNIILRALLDFFWLAVYFSPFSLFFSVAGMVLLAKKSQKHKGIIFSFALVPALLLLFCGLLIGYYIEILTPLLFVSMGFYTYLLLSRQRDGKTFWIRIFLLFFLLSHLTSGIGSKYFFTIKEWKMRNLPAYEQEILKVIPSGSLVLGTAQDWYALNRSGSKLVLFESTVFSPSWNKFDYIILSPFADLSRIPQAMEFINNNTYEILRVGSGGRNYILPNGFNRNSGYSAVIFKVKK
ncbi:MAG TPA: glycosyltransferase family 39 protein [Candidatus Margulisiibacteriota bacterium]|nr:glycosyltransferase family 39 protein [Candidatus Margulisiibacteriota bacterium]